MKITADELAIAHQHQIDLLKNSHSWRITSPFTQNKNLSCYSCAHDEVKR